MKRILIVSPYFPPVNSADMQRVRMSLPYFEQFGWVAEVVMVDEHYTDIPQDDLLLQSIPHDVVVHKVKALNKKHTSRVGLGSLALRAMRFYRKKVDKLLSSGGYNLVYFSTTQFPICALGPRWKKKFGVPYVIDMQDPWHSTYYQDKPKAQQPPKYWFSYRLNKYLEPVAVKKVGGLIAVSQKYIDTLKQRYPKISEVPSATITFGAFEPDMEIALKNRDQFTKVLNEGSINIVYVGRGGMDLHKSIEPVFKAFKAGLGDGADLQRIRFYFIGTSYAPTGTGVPTIIPLAEQYGIANYVTEITDRISYYHALATLTQADALFIPGSDDPQYTASKIYPYLMTGKPVLAIFNPNSPAIPVLKAYGVVNTFDYESVTQNALIAFLKDLAAGKTENPQYNIQEIKKHSAKQMAAEQCRLFDAVVNKQD